ncbi:hypothetical protein FQN54_006145 [Arachnomyces sp. PD_36]|nr:hypothetical protein FQN54_006145 [Arachnomyces sp. PD_36]
MSNSNWDHLIDPRLLSSNDLGQPTAQPATHLGTQPFAPPHHAPPAVQQIQLPQITVQQTQLQQIPLQQTQLPQITVQQNPGWVPVAPHAERYTDPVNIGTTQPVTALRLTRSDGVQQPPPLDRFVKSEHVIFIAYSNGDDYDVGKRMALGGKLAERLNVPLLSMPPNFPPLLAWHFSQLSRANKSIFLTDGTSNYILYEWPRDYAAYHLVKGKESRATIDPANLRRNARRLDFCLFGHPRRTTFFDKMDRMADHFASLARGSTDGCRCKKC